MSSKKETTTEITYNGGYEALCITIAAINRVRVSKGEREFIQIDDNGLVVTVTDEKNNMVLKSKFDIDDRRGIFNEKFQKQMGCFVLGYYLESVFHYQNMPYVEGDILYDDTDKRNFNNIIDGIKDIPEIFFAERVRYELPPLEGVNIFDDSISYHGGDIHYRDFYHVFFECCHNELGIRCEKKSAGYTE